MVKILKIIKDLSIIGAVDISAAAISAVFWFYVASLLGPEDYGEVSYIIAIAQTASTVSLLGAPHVLIVYTAKNVRIQPALSALTLMIGTAVSIILFLFYYNTEMSFLILGYMIFSLVTSTLLGQKLFGEYAKTILKENNYPIERLITFGNSFFFDFDKIEKKLNNENLLKKYNINKSQKVILFTTGTHQRKYTIQGKYDFDEQIWRHLLENFAGNDDYFLILKPHPIESNIEPYLEILEKFPSNNVKLVQFADNRLPLVQSSVILQ